jgi:hypothetical protein
MKLNLNKKGFSCSRNIVLVKIFNSKGKMKIIRCKEFQIFKLKKYISIKTNLLKRLRELNHGIMIRNNLNAKS